MIPSLAAALFLAPACAPTSSAGGRSDEFDSAGSVALDSGADSSPPGDTADPGDSWDPPDDGPRPPSCTDAVAEFHADDGTVTDLSEPFTTGAYTTLDVPGTLYFCPGTWFVHAVIRSQVRVLGLGEIAAHTILSGGELGTVLDVAGEGATLSLEMLTVDRGSAIDRGHDSGGGGIVCADFASVDAVDVAFSSNRGNDGAAIFATDCAVDLDGILFTDNVADDDGGAIALWWSTATIARSLFTGNSALDGGALAAFYSTADLHATDFIDNTATHIAGAAWIYESSATANDVDFSGNEVPGGDGGALFVQGDASLQSCGLADNIATRGAGVFVYYNDTMTCTACFIADNEADDLYAAGYDEDGGTSYTVGTAATVRCAANACTVE